MHEFPRPPWLFSASLMKQLVAAPRKSHECDFRRPQVACRISFGSGAAPSCKFAPFFKKAGNQAGYLPVTVSAQLFIYSPACLSHTNINCCPHRKVNHCKYHRKHSEHLSFKGNPRVSNICKRIDSIKHSKVT